MNSFKLFLVFLLALLISGCQNTNSTFINSDTQPSDYSPFLTYITTNHSNNPDFISKTEIEDSLIGLFPNPDIVTETLKNNFQYLGTEKHFFILESPNKYEYCLYVPIIKNPPEQINFFADPYYIYQSQNNLHICSAKLEFYPATTPPNSFLTINHFNTNSITHSDYIIESVIKKLLTNTPLSLLSENNQIIINTSQFSSIIARHDFQIFIDHNTNNFLDIKKISDFLTQKYSSYYLTPNLLNLNNANSILYQENPNYLQISFQSNTIAQETFDKISSSFLLQNTYNYQTFSLPDDTKTTTYSPNINQKLNPEIKENKISYNNINQIKSFIILSDNYLIISQQSDPAPIESTTNIIPYNYLVEIKPEIFETFDFIKSIQYNLSENAISGYMAK